MKFFQEGIAEDTVSDAVGNILRHRFAAFTKLVCDDHGVPTAARPHLRGRFNPIRRRWERIVVQAPLNPYSNKQVLLVPKQYLRPLPTLNPDDFWGYCCDQSAQELRTELGEEISRNVRKEAILEKALGDYQSVEEYVRFLERIGGAPYDLDNDPKGLVKWYKSTKKYVMDHPKKLTFENEVEFTTFIQNLVLAFKNYVENQGGWELIYNDNGQPKSESACQRLSLGMVRHYCLANNIDVSPEVNVGRGPVDFKASQGSALTALIEMKLAKNTKFWAGLERQLPKYLEAEEARVGHFLVITFNESDVARLENIYTRIKEVNEKTSYHISTTIVEAVFRPPSASKL